MCHRYLWANCKRGRGFKPCCFLLLASCMFPVLGRGKRANRPGVHVVGYHRIGRSPTGRPTTHGYGRWTPLHKSYTLSFQYFGPHLFLVTARAGCISLCCLREAVEQGNTDVYESWGVSCLQKMLFILWPILECFKLPEPGLTSFPLCMLR